jgi:hypothetical protein
MMQHSGDHGASVVNPWRFLVYVRGISGLPREIEEVGISWKTKLRKARVRLSVKNSSGRFERGCLVVDTHFARSPLNDEASVVRDKLLVFTVKGYYSSLQHDDSGVRIGAFSFRCLQIIDESFRRVACVLKAAVQPPDSSCAQSVVVSLLVDCFPLWMAPAFSVEDGASAEDAEENCQSEAKQLLKTLEQMSRQYVAARSLLCQGFSNGSIAILDPIFRTPHSFSTTESLFPSPPFPTVVCDASFSALIAPVLLQECITAQILKMYRVQSAERSIAMRKKVALAAAAVHRIVCRASILMMRCAFRAWVGLKQRLDVISDILQRSRQR